MLRIRQRTPRSAGGYQWQARLLGQDQPRRLLLRNLPYCKLFPSRKRYPSSGTWRPRLTEPTWWLWLFKLLERLRIVDSGNY